MRAKPIQVADDAFARSGVSVWRVEIDVGEEPSDAVLQDLSDSEFERVATFHKVGDRARFATMRSVSRRRLGEALGVAARDVPILIDERGKPRVPDDEIWFSLAHSGDLGMLAISRGDPVGVDVEAMGELEGLRALADYALSPSERSMWNAQSGEVRRRLFFRAWTAKEALLKASGSGLVKNPLDLSVLADDGSLALRGEATRIGFDPARALVRILPAPPGYSAAIALITALGADPFSPGEDRIAAPR